MNKPWKVPISAREVEAGMHRILESGESEEGRHAEMDKLLMKTLVSLGYGEGVKVFKSTPKWYA